MSNELQTVPAHFKPGSFLQGRLSLAVVLEVREAASHAILLLLPSGGRIVAEFWQFGAWDPVPPLTEGWRIERLTGSENPDWDAYLPDAEFVAAILNDHQLHGKEQAHRYRVVPPDGAGDDELSQIEDLGGIL